MEKYAKLAEEIERACESPMTKEIITRAIAREDWVGLANMAVGFMARSDLNVLTWDEIEELNGSVEASQAELAHIRQENTGSGRVRS